MKKIIYMVFLLLLLVGCSSKESDDSNLSLESFIDAFVAEGVEVNPDEKPMFSLIGAKDGIIFYNDGQPVKIYEFDSEKNIKEGEKALPAMKDWDRNGMFMLETSHDKSKEIFNNVK